MNHVILTEISAEDQLEGFQLKYNSYKQLNLDIEKSL